MVLVKFFLIFEWVYISKSTEFDLCCKKTKTNVKTFEYVDTERKPWKFDEKIGQENTRIFLNNKILEQYKSVFNDPAS